MNVDDRVRHKRHGQGVIVGFASAGDRGRYAKVLFDGQDAPRLVMENRLVAIPSWSLPRDEASGDVQAPENRRKDRSVPYKDLDRFREQVERDNPDADRVVALLYNERMYCEVWRGGAASIVIEAPPGQGERPVRRRKRR